jgi:hypothetical protein
MRFVERSASLRNILLHLLEFVIRKSKRQRWTLHESRAFTGRQRGMRAEPSREGNNATVGATGPAIAPIRAKHLEPKGHLFGASGWKVSPDSLTSVYWNSKTPLRASIYTGASLLLKLLNPISR